MKKFLIGILLASTVCLSASQSYCKNLFNSPTEEAFLKEKCDGDCSQLMSLDYRPNDILSMAEQYVVQNYTESNKILSPEIMLNAVKKLPAKRITAYRGGQKSKKPAAVGQIIELSRLTSVSEAREVAEGFVVNQLMIIKTKNAHDISSYSVVGEKEFILIPRTKLRIDKISQIKIDLSEQNETNIVDVQLLELTEVE